MLDIRKYKDRPQGRINIIGKTFKINWIITSLKIFKKKYAELIFDKDIVMLMINDIKRLPIIDLKF